MSPEEVNLFLKQSFEGFISESPTNAKWESLRGDLLCWIQGLPPEEAFAGLTSAIETNDRYQVQWLAGDLLLRATIPCKLTADEWLGRVITKLNSSSDTVARYGISVFGQKVLADTAKTALIREGTNEPQKSGLRTMLYFLHEG